MRHRKQGKKISRTADKRKLLARKMAISLLREEKISTTPTKARYVQGFVEPLITKGKPGTLEARRHIIAQLGNAEAAKLVLEKAKQYQERKGGYTRITKLSERRGGSNTPLVRLEFV